MEQLYKNIRARRIELGMTQQELADKMGYTNRSSIAKVDLHSTTQLQTQQLNCLLNCLHNFASKATVYTDA